MTRQVRSVTQKTTTGKYVGAFASISVAEALTGTNNSDITKSAKGKRKSAGGAVWSYRASAIRRDAGRYLVYNVNDELVASTNVLPLLDEEDLKFLKQYGRFYVGQYEIKAN